MMSMGNSARGAFLTKFRLVAPFSHIHDVGETQCIHDTTYYKHPQADLRRKTWKSDLAHLNS